MSKNYFCFEAALAGSFFCQPETSRFSRVWQAEDSVKVKFITLTGRVWENGHGLYAAGYLYNKNTGFADENRNVLFAALPCSSLAKAVSLANELVTDASRYHEGYLHKLGGENQIN